MKLISHIVLCLALAAGALAQTIPNMGSMNAGGVTPPGTGAGTVTSVSVTTANGVSGSVATATTTPAISLTLGAITPTSVNGNFFTTGSSTYTGTAGQTYTFPTTSATIARTDAANTFTGVQTFPGSFIRTPVDITIAANAGPIDITKGISRATNGANTTLTPSANGADGQGLLLKFVNSDTAAHTVTVDTTVDFTFTAAASSTTTVFAISDGSGWSLMGGPTTINDLTTVTVASGDLFGFWDISGGVTGKATAASIVSTALTATPATVAQGGTGLATLTANNVILGNGTSNVAFVAPGTSGNVLTSNGTTWTSAAAAGGTTPLFQESYTHSAVVGASGFGYDSHGFSISNDGTAASVAVTATATGYVKFTSAATLNADAGVKQNGVTTTFGVYPSWVFRAKLASQALGVLRCWIGAAYDGTALPPTDTPVTSMAAFRYSTSAGDTNWQCVTNDNSGSCTVTSSGVAADANLHVFKIITGASNVKFYLDGVLVATNTTDLPVTGAQIGAGYRVQVRTLEAVAKEIWWQAMSETVP